MYILVKIKILMFKVICNEALWTEKGVKNLLGAAPGPPEIHTKKKGVNYEISEIDENKA